MSIVQLFESATRLVGWILSTLKAKNPIKPDSKCFALSILRGSDEDALVLDYNTASRCSFDSIPLHFDPVKYHPIVIILLIGNKLEKEERQVQQQEGLELAKKLGGSFSEMCARTGRGTDGIFPHLASLLLERQSNHVDDTTCGYSDDITRASTDRPHESFLDCIPFGSLSCVGRA